MTDKTDIEALRDRLASEANRVRDQRYVDEHCCIVNKRDLLTTVDLLKQLEAERQQREAAEKERDELLNQEFQQRLVNAEHQLEIKDLAIRNIKSSRMAQFRKRKTAEAEIAALRGEQEPFGYAFDDRAGNLQITRYKPALAHDHKVEIVELFTRPPKPVVVLPQRYSPCSLAGQGIAVKDSTGDYLNYQQVVISLSSADIVVKDGE